MRHRVIIVGGGFGGMYAAKNLRRVPVDVLLIDRRNFHLFQPLLYQVATGGLSPGDITAPLRSVLKKNRRAGVIMAEVTAVDIASRIVRTSAGDFPYDTLVVAAGAAHQYFGHDEWAPLAPGLKTIEDAVDIRSRLLAAFEQAEIESDEAARRALMTFVVAGGGPTGVELAGAIGEIAHHTLRGEFRRIDPGQAEIILVEGAERVLQNYPPFLSEKAVRSLHKLGVTVRTRTLVTDLTPESVTLASGGVTTVVPCRTVLWAAGVSASPLGRMVVGDRTDLLDRVGRVETAPDLSVPGRPEIFVIGDLASYRHQTGAPLPGLAPVAMQQGRYVARVIGRRLRGKTVRPFRYFDKGNLATIGRNAAVGTYKRLRFWGYPAWLTWLFVHLMYLVEFDNRLVVLVQWVWSYITRNRGARLISRADGRR
ncbi:MAG TPA: NAD(P)/FAD-dependent oxidoreductase [candidate division Zixibacteria bacterium]|nr:NAD(P)/FAD-dependent oxidoreductase [candidate division Zixibacteria bacterium]MDM7972693.1 NAD(P)/FAD-dependent oxidoreductase [candidate division Zixibacteria bacterium]HOD65392.1 NAD(P)/FAD-dependent oxidoreductase [candidate division Zixibacteria bacterium]HOZ07877.1 NAD(P)/FAD-dependent oxidoreductase [candidate division Zixibacteria bacterium]HPC11471.1 NAD(P)/FAD-dependent oxidoreductase [candidate division Zixibacteria bacterium]